MTVVDDARQSPVVEALYKQVSAKTPINVELAGGVSWASKTVGGETTIRAANAQYPAAALYHELLHADLKNSGYRQYSQFLFTNRRTLALKGILEALDNELQHHRIFGSFTGAGFAADTFYADDDISTYRVIREDLAGMRRSAPARDYLLRFLTVIAPGGCGSDDDRCSLRDFLFYKAGPNTRGKLETIENHIAAWTASTEMDPGHTLLAIIHALGDYGGAWFGANQDFPSGGHFTGNPFSPEVAEDFLLSQGLIS
jgi:hypothetical protein